MKKKILIKLAIGVASIGVIFAIFKLIKRSQSVIASKTGYSAKILSDGKEASGYGFYAGEILGKYESEGVKNGKPIVIFTKDNNRYYVGKEYTK